MTASLFASCSKSPSLGTIISCNIVKVVITVLYTVAGGSYSSILDACGRGCCTFQEVRSVMPTDATCDYIYHHINASKLD